MVELVSIGPLTAVNRNLIPTLAIVVMGLTSTLVAITSNPLGRLSGRGRA